MLETYYDSQNDGVFDVSSRPSNLPDFSNPPVVEAVLSVQFDLLSSIRAAHFGLYWKEIIDRFPRTEERGELQPAIEVSNDSASTNFGIQFQALENPTPPRFWFTNSDQTELIQVQRDRFIKNWRKVGEGDQYPRYEPIREGFKHDFDEFSEFTKRHELGEIHINQYEISYINHIVACDIWSSHSEIDKVFTFWTQPKIPFPGPAQDLVLHARFPILDSAGAFIGRLHANLRPVNRITDGLPMFIFDLTARGRAGDGVDFFDLGRECIVRSFTELTTPAMHEVWGRKS